MKISDPVDASSVSEMFDADKPLYWLDEENAGDQPPPPHAIVCESHLLLNAHMRQLPKGSHVIVCIVLGPEKRTELGCDLNPGVKVDLAVINMSNDNVTLGGIERRPTPSIGTT
jgi:hypothetical protein